MKIKEVMIHNWRSIEDVTVECQDLMVIIGQNNHGKSNLLSAILFFFGEIELVEMDFRKGTDELYVEVEFEDLDDDDKGLFPSYLTTENTIRVRKKASKSDGAGYNGYKNIPSEAFLRAETMTREEFVACPLVSFDPGGRITKAALQEAQAQYIAANQAALQLTYELETTPFLDSKNLVKGIFGRMFFIPAVRSASDELGVKGKSAFGQLFTNVINLMSDRNQQYKDIKNQMAAMIQSLNKLNLDGAENTARPEEIGKLEQKIGEELATWGAKIEVEVTAPDIDNLLKVGTNVWVDDGVKTDVGRKGHGLQRSLIFALIKSWADILRERSNPPESEDTEQTASVRSTSDSTFFIFEEPELFLHPQAQKELFSSLRLLSSENQVFLTSHSSFFIHIADYKSICIAHKEGNGTSTKICQCTEDLFANSTDQQKFNLAYWINPERGELFFAKKVILVEGQTDKTVIPFIARKIINNFSHEYTLVDCASKNNMPLYIHLLNKFKRPYIVVYDKDHQSSKSQSAKNDADTASQAIANAIDATFGSAIIFDNDIEEEIGPIVPNKSKALAALQTVAASGYTLPSQLRAKIEAIYT